MVFKKESDFEEALIKILSEKGWEKEVIKYPTEKELIQNWANILFDNNRGQDRLDKYPLTEGEMQQIIEQIMELRTPLKLNGFINGKTVWIGWKIDLSQPFSARETMKILIGFTAIP